jgi:hypothetical protein
MLAKYKYFGILGVILVGGWLASEHREEAKHSRANEHAAVFAQQGVTGLYTSQPSVDREEATHSWANKHAAVFAQQGVMGLYTSQPSVAPLRIVTPMGDQKYFMKLVDANSGSVVESMFVYGGQSFDMNVPLGTYRIRYASGSTWYGETDLFGPETTYSEFDSVFSFTDYGHQVSGYTVELIRQHGGNLRERNLSPSQF